MPLWLLVVLMSLTVYRCTRLIIKDTLPPVLWLRHHLVGGWGPVVNGEASDPIYRDAWVPEWLADLWSCPWCVSGWIAGAVTLLTDLTIGVAAPVLTGFAVWALGAILASREDL